MNMGLETQRGKARPGVVSYLESNVEHTWNARGWMVQMTFLCKKLGDS